MLTIGSDCLPHVRNGDLLSRDLHRTLEVLTVQDQNIRVNRRYHNSLKRHSTIHEFEMRFEFLTNLWLRRHVCMLAALR